eukprot:12914992-Prorocentrum_lima.AAC.1
MSCNARPAFPCLLPRHARPKEDAMGESRSPEPPVCTRLSQMATVHYYYYYYYYYYCYYYYCYYFCYHYYNYYNCCCYCY